MFAEKKTVLNLHKKKEFFMVVSTSHKECANIALCPNVDYPLYKHNIKHPVYT